MGGGGLVEAFGSRDGGGCWRGGECLYNWQDEPTYKCVYDTEGHQNMNYLINMLDLV